MIANKATSGITREYLAIAKGSVRPLEGTITAPLGRKEGSIIERTVDFENGESAVTHYRVLDEKNGHSLVSLILETGRTHQIRIHMKYLGYPLIGDYLYNPDMEQIQRAGVTCLEAVLCPSHHRGENTVHCAVTGGYGSGINTRSFFSAFSRSDIHRALPGIVASAHPRHIRLRTPLPECRLCCNARRKHRPSPHRRSRCRPPYDTTYC